MSAVLDTITDLSKPAEAAAEIQRLNDQLAAERTIPPAIAAAVKEIATGIEETNLRRWETVDPTHAVIVLRSAVSAQLAVEEPDSPAARDQLRVALESIRQSLAAIAEREPVSAERTPKQIVQWLAARTEVPQVRLARAARRQRAPAPAMAVDDEAPSPKATTHAGSAWSRGSSTSCGSRSRRRARSSGLTGPGPTSARARRSSCSTTRSRSRGC